jgi:hypothetical protein
MNQSSFSQFVSTNLSACSLVNLEQMLAWKLFGWSTSRTRRPNILSIQWPSKAERRLLIFDFRGDKGSYALLGTLYCTVLVRMLRDYHVALGRKTISMVRIVCG